MAAYCWEPGHAPEDLRFYALFTFRPHPNNTDANKTLFKT